MKLLFWDKFRKMFVKVYVVVENVLFVKSEFDVVLISIVDNIFFFFCI